ncbi:RNA cytidine acetyltransferase l(1)G0020 [Nomia melanderi]|uniref:RNA cytidine acetyltransferase l(1)G0020 n=1 Tax=Nomia melanderi TaxID=2448451 RepID=UPI00130433CF|nr:RNA cytidine acetyltransferase [Nomia melanderi]XP_031840139.1 RNA cytidine acetyltransferase [Nomia melanderi]XP_031840140.1 RNA cytidine acetyltransferase [Nomia melanderi]XP_031840141.1 RNA cytidine acetyltransferase [Nomia melanderi]XP_031840142.1 RNA cytidine acetyltransferase [Nomia melanderi]
MVRKKIDNRIRVLIENGVITGHRTMFIVIGEKARDQVVLLHHMLSKTVIKARPSVLWCYKKELGFSSHRKKRMKSLQKKIKSGKIDVNEDDPFELFVVSTNIRYCYYHETHKILGNTYGMCVLQDFEAITPNLLARTIETIEGGGIIVFLLQSVNSLKQLYTMNMDVHQRFRTEAHQDIVGRFNERFLLSLASCKRCLVVDDQLNVLPLSSHNLKIEPAQKLTTSEEQSELDGLKDSLKDTQPISSLVNCCKTIDQAKALLKFIECISEKTLRSTVSLTAARGRGKSAALGLAIAGSITFGYSNIYISSPSPENLNTLFEFVFKGFDALGYQEHLDYGLVQSTNPEFNKATVRVNVFRDHRQTIQYIHPTDAHKLNQAELLVIDEAAAIPLPYVKAMLGPYLVFLASTINGYEGTGRSLSLKLLQQLRSQTAGSNRHEKHDKHESEKTVIGRQLHELTLEESIRYKPGDSVEQWLCDLLCLNATTNTTILSGCPPPDLCQLYYINRDTLFSYHKASELFLQRLVALYVASHYKNSPNDLQMMSDAPAHHLFCLLGPVDSNKKTLPEILVVIQICLEGEVSKNTIKDGLTRGRRAAGDLIPWTMAQQYQDQDFPALAGSRIVRIATHPDYHGMGYGSRALELLKQYYEMKVLSVDETSVETPITEISKVQDEEVNLLEERIEPRSSLPPLLLKLSERRPENLDYLGVSFGITEQLLKFWKRAGFVPTYLRQTANDITGEHSCIMLYKLNFEQQQEDSRWLQDYWNDFRRRFITLLSFSFNAYPSSLALSILMNKTITPEVTSLKKDTLDVYFTSYDLKRLAMYSNNMADYHLIMDLLPPLARLYFLNMMGDTHLSAVQSAILLGLGLQHKTVDKLAEELDLPPSQLLALFNRIIRKSVQYLNGIAETYIENAIMKKEFDNQNVQLNPVNGKSLHDELETAAKELKVKQKAELEKLKRENLEQYAIKGSDGEWKDALSGKKSKNLISIKSSEKKISEDDSALELQKKQSKKRKRHSFKT